MNKLWWEDILLWLCDFNVFIFVFLCVVLFGFVLKTNNSVGQSPIIVMDTPSRPIIETFQTTDITSSPTTPPTFISPVPVTQKPEFIIVFIPVNWRLGQEVFRQTAQNHADTFIKESNINTYFEVGVVILEDGIDGISLESNDVVYDIIVYGAQNYPGDRYIGLTDGDVRPDGESNVVGWTSGGIGVIAEYNDKYVVTHELGHTFGLCDEYNYLVWIRQDAEFKGGCPNIYPPDCPTTESNEPICEGQPAQDGSNSIMGPAGLPGGYSFNEESLSHLEKVFSAFSNGDIP